MSCKWLYSFLTFVLFMGACVSAQASADASDSKAVARQQKAAKDSLRVWLKEARQNANDKAKPNFSRARAALRKAMSNPYGTDNADVLLLAANTEYLCFNNERNKPATGGKIDEKVIYSSTADGFHYYCKAYDMFHHPEAFPTMQGVKPLSRKELAQMRSNAYELFRATRGFRATAGYYAQQKNWGKAHEFFSLALHSLDCEMLTDYAAESDQVDADFQSFRTDSLRSHLLHSCAVTAVMTGDHQLAITELSAARHCGVETNGVYQQLCKEYLAVGDSLHYLAMLQEGMSVVSSESWFPERLLNHYLQRSDYELALTVIDRVIATSSDSANNLQMKARLLDQLGRDDEAVPYYQQAISLDSTLFISYMNLGSICYNRAVACENELVDQRRFDAIYDEAVPLYELALPYYNRAFDLDVKREDSRIPEAIRTILFKRFQSPRCTNSRELIKRYNEVSRAYGWSTL